MGLSGAQTFITTAVRTESCEKSHVAMAGMLMNTASLKASSLYPVLGLRVKCHAHVSPR